MSAHGRKGLDAKSKFAITASDVPAIFDNIPVGKLTEGMEGLEPALIAAALRLHVCPQLSLERCLAKRCSFLRGGEASPQVAQAQPCCNECPWSTVSGRPDKNSREDVQNGRVRSLPLLFGARI